MRAAYFRNFIFGVEDSLVLTVGLLSGIAIILGGVLSSMSVWKSALRMTFVSGFAIALGLSVGKLLR